MHGTLRIDGPKTKQNVVCINTHKRQRRKEFKLRDFLHILIHAILYLDLFVIVCRAHYFCVFYLIIFLCCVLVFIWFSCARAPRAPNSLGCTAFCFDVPFSSSFHCSVAAFSFDIECNNKNLSAAQQYWMSVLKSQLDLAVHCIHRVTV